MYKINATIVHVQLECVTDRIKFVYDGTKLDLYWHFDSASEKVIESPAMS